MTRKERKRARKNKNKKVENDTEIREIAKALYKLALVEREKNRHLYHSILITKDNKKGCFNSNLKIILCSKCFYGRCMKWDDPTIIYNEEGELHDDYNRF